jgi:hypothetical protein
MAIIIDCPSCRRKLRVPEEYLDTAVRCPNCATTFDAPKPDAQPAPVSASPMLNVPLQLEIDEKPPGSGDKQDEPRRDRIRRRRRDFEPCPRCGDDIRRGAVACPYCGYDLEEQADGYTRLEPVRRDAEPHRGRAIQALGIGSLVCAAFYFFPIGLPLGIAAWVMGRRDLKKMDAGVMEPNGRRKTRDGWLCGVIGTILNGLWALSCGGFVGMIILVEEESAANRARMQPAVAQQAAGGGGLFTLHGPSDSIRIEPGETKQLRVDVRRALNSKRTVIVAINQNVVPDGVTVTPPQIAVAGRDSSAAFNVTVAKNADLGRLVLRLYGTDNVGNRVDIEVPVFVEPK